MSGKLAIILGASGSVGKVLLAEIIRSGDFSGVIAVSRRTTLPSSHGGLPIEERLVPDMQPQPLRLAVARALKDRATEAIGFSVLGVGAGTAKLTLAQHRAIDVDLNAAFAAGLKASGLVRHLVFMSAIGADIHASTSGPGAAGMPRYARVKGEAEAAVLSQGLPIVSIFQPSVIIDSQHTPRALGKGMALLSPLIPTKYRPISTTEIALAMVTVAMQQPQASATYTYADMKALAAGHLRANQAAG